MLEQSRRTWKLSSAQQRFARFNGRHRVLKAWTITPTRQHTRENACTRARAHTLPALCEYGPHPIIIP